MKEFEGGGWCGVWGVHVKRLVKITNSFKHFLTNLICISVLWPRVHVVLMGQKGRAGTAGRFICAAVSRTSSAVG